MLLCQRSIRQRHYLTATPLLRGVVVVSADHHRLPLYTSTASISSHKVPVNKHVISTDVIVCGGGLAGLNVAYHLAKKKKRVTVLEKNSIGISGATGHCLGMLSAPYFFGDNALQRRTESSYKLYEELANKHRFQFTKCGRLYLASTEKALWKARRMYARSQAYPVGDPCELIEDPKEIFARWPFLSTDDFKTALYSPADVCLDTIGLCRALVAEIKQAGGNVMENITVQKILVGENQHIYAVATDQGLVDAHSFVNAAGYWSNLIRIKNFNRPTTPRIAVHPCTYTYLSTQSIPSTVINENTPAIIDFDNSIFIRATDYSTICGGFLETDVQALSHPEVVQGDWNIPSPDWDRFYGVLKRTMTRIPALGQLDAGELVTNAESYTPDGYPISGEIDQINGYYVIGGFNNNGLAFAGGVGEALADVIVYGSPGRRDVSKVDVTRFLDLHTNPQYLHERAPEVASNTFNAHLHSYQCHTARNLRMSPIYHQLRNAGAVFGESMGYERPLWFSNKTDPTRNALFMGQDPVNGKPPWFPYVSKEYEACRERVAIMDLSSFAKLEVGGSGVIPFLQRICSANIDVPIGSTVYTGMQNEFGGYVTDCTISRISESKFFVIAPTVQQLRCKVWLLRWKRKWNANIYVNDVTSMYTGINVVGPQSRYLMQDITGLRLTSTDFPPFSYREINIGMATGIRAISVTHSGELGWVLYVPNEVAQNVYSKIVEAGEEYSLLHAGYIALRHLRIEKFYVYWGQDINSLVTPVECGRMFRVDFEKDFIGKNALVAEAERGVSRRFVQLLIDNHNLDKDPWPQGNELIYRNGEPCGWTTSAAYAFTLGSQVAIGYIENKQFGVSQQYVSNGSYEIDIANKRFPARLNLHSPSLPMVSSEHPTHYRPTQQ